MAQGRNNSAIAASLFITQRAVEKHINSIFAKLGVGFDDDVPPASACGAALPHGRSVMTGAAAVTQPSMLIVDDHRSFRAATTALLGERFTVVGEADSGEQAVEMAAGLRPDVIVMDVATSRDRRYRGDPPDHRAATRRPSSSWSRASIAAACPSISGTAAPRASSARTSSTFRVTMSSFG